MRSSVSVAGVGTFAFSSCGEVRRGRAVFTLAFCFSFEDDDLEVEEEDEEERDALEDIEVKGGRDRTFIAGCGALIGDDSVKSRVSMISDECRSCDGVGLVTL